MSNFTSIIGTILGTTLFVLSRILFKREKEIGGYFTSILGLSAIWYFWSESLGLKKTNDFGYLIFSFGVLIYMGIVFYLTDKLIIKKRK